MDTGAFVAYENREALLQEELIAAQLYRVIGEPEQHAEPFSGLKERITSMVQRLTEFQDATKRKTRISAALARGLPALAIVAASAAAVFVVQAEAKVALFACGATVFLTLLNLLLGPTSQLAENRHLSREIETMKWKLEEYLKTDSSRDPNAKVQRELLLAMIQDLAQTKAGS